MSEAGMKQAARPPAIVARREVVIRSDAAASEQAQRGQPDWRGVEGAFAGWPMAALPAPAALRAWAMAAAPKRR